MLFRLTALLVLITLAAPCRAFAFSKDYSRLVEFMRGETEQVPSYPFSEFEAGLDQANHKANLDYFNGHPELIVRIKNDLGAGELKWRLDNHVQRLLFIPETRQEFAGLYEEYCRELVAYVLGATGLDNPLAGIETLREPRPRIAGQGVTAFLVRDVKKESVATYVFSNPTTGKSSVIELKGQITLGEVGSYTTSIYLREDGTFEFVPNHYTIWQNSAENPYTALMVPAEETLHIALRRYTERAIKEALAANVVTDIGQVDAIAQDWIQVEEAIVGGLVRALLPDFLNPHATPVPDSWIESDGKTKNQFSKYCHMDRGIQVVKDMGCGKAVAIYRENPKDFRNLLALPPPSEPSPDDQAKL